jgi:pimeloyl-ACP methyl ester carboxylesterase
MGTNTADGGYKTVRIGVKYERFNDCVKDIDAWLKKAAEFGYSEVILLGHSLGGPKVVHYMYEKQPKNVTGIILVSPADIAGMGSSPSHQHNYKQLHDEAKECLAQRKPRQVLSGLIWDYYHLSAQTFLDFFTENGPADILPLFRNPKEFPQLASIAQPILCVMGEHDDIIIRSLSEDMDLLETKATHVKSFTKNIIPGANHTYDKKEKELSTEILKWIKTL